jgi:hypothetical protein
LSKAREVKHLMFDDLGTPAQQFTLFRQLPAAHQAVEEPDVQGGFQPGDPADDGGMFDPFDPRSAGHRAFGRDEYKILQIIPHKV